VLDVAGAAADALDHRLARIGCERSLQRPLDPETGNRDGLLQTLTQRRGGTGVRPSELVGERAGSRDCFGVIARRPCCANLSSAPAPGHVRASPASRGSSPCRPTSSRPAVGRDAHQCRRCLGVAAVAWPSADSEGRRQGQRAAGASAAAAKPPSAAWSASTTHVPTARAPGGAQWDGSGRGNTAPSNRVSRSQPRVPANAAASAGQGRATPGQRGQLRMKLLVVMEDVSASAPGHLRPSPWGPRQTPGSEVAGRDQLSEQMAQVSGEDPPARH
jgi:hypothetical protein